jgi:hypothetical protein
VESLKVEPIWILFQLSLNLMVESRFKFLYFPLVLVGDVEEAVVALREYRPFAA